MSGLVLAADIANIVSSLWSVLLTLVCARSHGSLKDGHDIESWTGRAIHTRVSTKSLYQSTSFGVGFEEPVLLHYGEC